VLIGGSDLNTNVANTASVTSTSNGSLGLLATLNSEQRKRYDNKEIEYFNEWQISYLGDSYDFIGKAKIISSTDTDKRCIQLLLITQKNLMQLLHRNFWNSSIQIFKTFSSLESNLNTSNR
jgi:hypothetical protein